jgi:hypothetical protein
MAGDGRSAPRRTGQAQGLGARCPCAFILDVLKEALDTTLDEMVERLREVRAMTVLRTAVRKFLDRHEQTQNIPFAPESTSA